MCQKIPVSLTHRPGNVIFTSIHLRMEGGRATRPNRPLGSASPSVHAGGLLSFPVGHCRREPKRGNGSEKPVGPCSALILLRKPTPTRPTNPLIFPFCAREFSEWDNQVGQSPVRDTVHGGSGKAFLADRCGVSLDLAKALMAGDRHDLQGAAAGFGQASGGGFAETVRR